MSVGVFLQGRRVNPPAMAGSSDRLALRGAGSLRPWRRPAFLFSGGDEAIHKPLYALPWRVEECRDRKRGENLNQPPGLFEIVPLRGENLGPPLH
jgi:hypothetical protein